jgi:hypothetical protein
MNGRPKFEPNHSRSLGIERTEQKILVCKAEMRRKFIDVDAPRLTPMCSHACGIADPSPGISAGRHMTFDRSGGLVALGAAE